MIKHLVTAFEIEGFNDPRERLIYLQMVYAADRKGLVRLTQEEIAEAVLVSRQTVVNKLRVLIDNGFLKKLGHGRHAIVLEATADDRMRRKVRDGIRDAWGKEPGIIAWKPADAGMDPDMASLIASGLHLGILTKSGDPDRGGLQGYTVDWGS